MFFTIRTDSDAEGHCGISRVPRARVFPGVTAPKLFARTSVAGYVVTWQYFSGPVTVPAPLVLHFKSFFKYVPADVDMPELRLSAVTLDTRAVAARFARVARFYLGTGPHVTDSESETALLRVSLFQCASELIYIHTLSLTHTRTRTHIYIHV